MNTAKQVNVMVGLVFVSLVGLTLYFIWDTERAEQAEIRQEQVNVERGAHLFSLNCRSCHGLKGEGSLERAGLPGAPLNLDVNRAPKLTGGALEAQMKRFHDTIVCGRVGTVMPPWAIEQGGALNFFQIEQIVLLITSQFSTEGWDLALEQANHADEFLLKRFLSEAVSAEDTTLHLNDSVGIPVTTDEGEALIRIGPETLEDPYEVMRVVSVDAEARTIEVERGIDVAGTKAMEHETGAEIYNGPLAPGTTVTGDPEAQGFPPCGQRTASVATATPAPDGAGGGSATALTDGATLGMGDNFFEIDGQRNPTFSVAAGATVGVTVNNTGTAIHNMRVAGDDAEFDTDDDQVSDPDIISGGGSGTIDITIAAAGTYPYRCDFHPTDMAGNITVQ
jgi:plastocyanin/mono/diheme cytochrome c family protein